MGIELPLFLENGKGDPTSDAYFGTTGGFSKTLEEARKNLFRD
jgi:hypothetical protein